jgi:hypothetical protein
VRCICYSEWSEATRRFITITLEDSIRKVQENQDTVGLTGAHQLLIHADVILLEKNMNTLKRDIEGPLDAGKEADL